MGPRGRRARRRGLIVGAAVGSAAARRNQPNAAADIPEQQGTSDTAQQMADLEKLGELKASGILTQEEFDAKKKEILGL